jgi:N-acetylneuraminic acid mutarotase
MLNDFRTPKATFFALPLLLGALVSSSYGCAGGAGGATPSGADALRLNFPEQATSVLGGAHAFVARGDGFATDLGPDAADALGHWHSLSIALPADGEGDVRFHLIGGFEARVHELGASGQGTIAEHAVAYAREGGTSYWVSMDGAYEEWLLLDSGHARAGAPSASWEISGATLRQDGDAIVLADEGGEERVRVTAPVAYARGGRQVAARLSAHGNRIDLDVDVEGQVLVDPVWASGGAMATARMYHTATLLPSSGPSGRVLVAGGYPATGSSELYDVATNSWIPTANSMNTARMLHTAVLLGNGDVLVAGGYNYTSGTLSSCEIFHTLTNAWVPAASVASMASDRYLHTMTMLPMGTVLVSGGWGSAGVLANGEVYNPLLNTWTTTPPMIAGRYGHATALVNGQALVTGGYGNTGYLSSAEFYDPGSNHWLAAPGMNSARYRHTATALLNGGVLVTGGMNNGSPLATSEVYMPASPEAPAQWWSIQHPMSASRYGHSATLLQNGSVLVAGGWSSPSVPTVAELYTPTEDSNGYWATVGALSTARYGLTGTLLPNGQVLLAGGENSSGAVVGSADLFSPAGHATWTTTGLLNTPRGSHAAVLLPLGPYAGEVLVAGGNTNAAPMASPTLSSVEFYTGSSWTTGSWWSMNSARSHFTLTVLQSGDVLAAGGEYFSGWGPPSSLGSSEVFNHMTGVWTPVTASHMSAPRSDHTATLLLDGTVLVAGGFSVSPPFSANASADLFLTSNTWVPTGKMNFPRGGHTATLLPDGNVLVTGGEDTFGSLIASDEVYNAVNKTWTVVTPIPQTPRTMSTATLLNDGSGRVVVAGGLGFCANCFPAVKVPLNDSFYHNENGYLAGTKPMMSGRYQHTATLIGTTTVLAVGGITGPYGCQDGDGGCSTSLYPKAPGAAVDLFIYEGQNSTFWSGGAAPLNVGRYAHTATQMNNGNVLVAGGFTPGTTTALAAAEYYTP